MKKTTTICSLAAAGLMLFSACVKEIDPQNSSITEEQVNNAPGGFDNLVAGITNRLVGEYVYGGGRANDLGYPGFFLQRDLMGQDIAVESTGYEWFSTWYTCGTGLGPLYAYCQMPWTCYYKWIKSCNLVLEIAGAEPDADHRTGAGIACAMRAMFYMDLARMYATRQYAQDPKAETVPLVKENFTMADLSKNPRATAETLWTQILADLDRAETLLDGFKRSDVYTPDLSVVYGLKARAFLTMGKWKEAEEYARKAQQGYQVMTEKEYTSRAEGFNTPNSAWIFGQTHKETNDHLQGGYNSWGSQMIVEVSESGVGYAANAGAPKRIDRHLYETIPATDFRRKSFVDFAIDAMGTKAEKLAALADYSDSPQGLLETAAATKSKVVGGLSVKFRPKGGEHVNYKAAFNVAVPFMRVEEMKLIEAEAAGMQDEARGIALLTAFAKTRDPQYVYGKHTAEAYGSTYATPFQNEVWWQRRVELWGEGFATFDIKRLDKQVIRSYAGTNHPKGYRWNADAYGKNAGNYPNWMDLCITNIEMDYNTANITNNPTPLRPTKDSPAHTW